MGIDTVVVVAAVGAMEACIAIKLAPLRRLPGRRRLIIRSVLAAMRVVGRRTQQQQQQQQQQEEQKQEHRIQHLIIQILEMVTMEHHRFRPIRPLTPRRVLLVVAVVVVVVVVTAVTTEENENGTRSRGRPHPRALRRRRSHRPSEQALPPDLPRAAGHPLLGHPRGGSPSRRPQRMPRGLPPNSGSASQQQHRGAEAPRRTFVQSIGRGGKWWWFAVGSLYAVFKQPQLEPIGKK